MVECLVPFMGPVTLTSDLVLENRILSKSLILLKVGIPNLVCGCNF